MAAGATILVTTTLQKIGGQGTGGCSLQEAIYSANLHTNMAIDSVSGDGTDHFVTTDCLAGTGNDTIVLPAGAVFQMGSIINDAHNYMGPTGTPVIFSNITIEGNGSRLERTGNSNFRAFSVGTASINLNPGGTPDVVSGTGNLTIRNAHIKGFQVKGGAGAKGAAPGGGGMGAGGAIYVQGGTLTVDSCTFEANSAIGGDGGTVGADLCSDPNPEPNSGGGGGGLSGNGGSVKCDFRDIINFGGGGGGGARGAGGIGAGSNINGGGGGGGTVTNGLLGDISGGGAGGFRCGGRGADPFNNTGEAGQCAGGGGGGGSAPELSCLFISCGGGTGGNGSYGGGGGGAGTNLAGNGANGGDGGFGGGGGGSNRGGNGGNGGFGGGGGGFLTSGQHGNGGPFGGNGGIAAGGGGAGLGGAIFNDGGAAIIRNSTLSGNAVAGGVSLNDDGQGRGGAIFSNNGSLTVVGCTISGNMSASDVGPQPGGGIVVFGSGGGAQFTLRNTILSNNSGGDECFFTGTVTAAGSGNLIIDNFGCPGMVSSSDPQLGPLQNNSPGSTPTMAITTSSPAFDAGDDSVLGSPLLLTTDQRGVTRPQFMHTDIGAYEVRPCSITCPANIVVSNDQNQCGAIVNYPAPPTTSGDCRNPVTCSPASGSFFPVGTTTVTCTSGSASCGFTVTVNDTQAPKITCPPNITVQTANPNASCTVVTFPTPVATDNCPGVTVSCSPSSGSCFPVGVTTVTCTATDASGNTASCSFLVTVFDTCVQDDRTSDLLQWNSKTGDYLFTHCGASGFTLSGRGTISFFNGIRYLQDRRTNVVISNTGFNTATLTGHATVTVIPSPGVYQAFTLNQTNTHPTCTCPP